MRRTSLNFAVDAATLAALFGMVGTGLVMRFVLLPGMGGGEGRVELWGRGRHDWGDVHYYFSVALLAVLVVHLAMHWAWIWGMVSRWVTRHHPGHVPASAAMRNVTGVFVLGLFVTFSATFVWLAAATINELPARSDGRHGRGFRGGHTERIERSAPAASATAGNR